MIHIGRSGSTVVADLLGQHPQVRWEGEIYQRIFNAREYPDHSLPPITDVDAVDFAEECSNGALGRYYGFEVKFFHLRILGAELSTYLEELDKRLENLQIIVLRRKNTLRVVVSTLVARKTGIWHLKGRARPSPGSVRLDPEAVFVNRANSKLVDLLEECARDFALLDELLAQRRALRLSYEEDVAHDPRRAYERICAHLELPPRRVKVRLSRTYPYVLHELIENYDDIEALLRGSAFEWMLQSP